MSTTKITPAPLTRSLRTVAIEIGEVWPAVREEGRDSGFGLPMGQHPANPYWGAMRRLDSLDDDYGYDSAADIVRRFLDNAGNWRGEHARRIKEELRAALLHHDVERHTPTDLAPRYPSTAVSDSIDARRRRTMGRYRTSRRGGLALGWIARTSSPTGSTTDRLSGDSHDAYAGDRPGEEASPA